jgi:potassium-dependent mechanosensitive channel
LTRSGSFRRFASRSTIWKLRAARTYPRVLLLALFLVPLSLFVRWTDAQTQAITTPPSAASAIPLAQIADRAEELDRLLQEIGSQLTSKSELLNSESEAERQAEEIQERARQTKDLLAGTSLRLEIEDELRYWRSRSQEYSTQRKSLTARAANLEEQIRILDAQQPEWQATWDQIHGTPGIEAVVKRVKEELEKLESTRSHAQEQLNAVLTLQNQVSQQDQQISDVLAEVRQVQEAERGRILEPDSRPLWDRRESLEVDQGVPAFHRSFDRSLASTREFLRAHKNAPIIFVLVYLLALLALFRLKNYIEREDRPGIPPAALQVLRSPFSVALVATLIGTAEYIAEAPIGVALIFYLLFLLPVMRLLVPLTRPKLRIFLYVLAAFYTFEGLYLLIQLPPLLRRELYTVFVFAALVSFGWLVRPSHVRPLVAESRALRMVLIGARADLLLLIACLLANVIGYVSLAQILGLTAFVAPFVGAALYCAARVLNLILIIILHTNWVRSLLGARVQTVERWSGRLLAAAAAILWLRAILNLLTIYDGVVGALHHLFQLPIGTQAVHFTLGSALGVVVILLGGYALANALMFLLKSFVLSRLPLQRGVPYAISRVTYYILLLIVAVVSLAAAGVELNKFTVLTGALGVGLGFGLQNVVNNFVSGLILLFERPIHIGDTVDIGGLVGTVRRIGARSSTILTFQGAEVIVPNSNLISNQVVNWTLSSQWRRVDIPVGVAYGTDPERVIKLLVGVAESHKDVLLVRPPAAFFMGFGDSALNFELRFWSAQQDTWFELQSEVTVAVAKALREAEIEIPFPQRDLHVRSVDASIAESLTSNGGSTKAAEDKTEKSVRT